ncbi:MAG: TetR/AcrR family transcriptional regulator [Thermodesulfobacteriota bacterium]|nr:TetR/AcrR family transcriptional regulator [Thermodesulfobacteriota bacterium]
MGLVERRQREKETRRQLILDTARNLLFEEGINAVSMNHIAKDAELSIGTLYLYFKNKKEIFASLQEEGLDLLFEKIQGASRGVSDTRESLRQIAMAYLNFSEEYKDYYDIFNYFLSAPKVIFPLQLKRRIDEHGQKILGLVQSVLLDMAPTRQTDKARLKRLSIVFWSGLQGILALRKLENTVFKDETFEDLYAYIAETVITAIMEEMK